MTLSKLLCILSAAVVALAQDPAQGWLAYAKGVSPSGGILTHVAAKWRVPSNPAQGGAFYSPWFGIESSDNLNLIQPVNPWMGSSWSIYNEYFQWSPEHNENSASHTVQAGDELYGSVDFNAGNQSYTVYHSDLNDGWSVTSNIRVQRKEFGHVYKNYTIMYFVFEKVASCAQYPKNGEVTFYDIEVEYDGKPVTPVWTTGYVDEVCGFKANIINSTTIQITWNPNGENTLAKPLPARPIVEGHSKKF
eukprot:TRINITY_DN3217_c0_g1_i1.p1 TRINITY_DN3217_c0_g1~~TRINITY_DN3217_c0_g1_i1.p1  ORF type:complete len:248 (-),score=62.45 TRINITY_DN3217_c0_g1_i1:99-842(-)